MATARREKGGQFDVISGAMEERLREHPDLQQQLIENIEANLRRIDPVATAESLDLPGTDLDPTDFQYEVSGAVGAQLFGEPSAAGENQLITARAYWWGYQFRIPEAAMQDFNEAGNVVAAFMTLGGSAIAASGGTLAPVLAVTAAYVAAELALMNVVDGGKGVYLTASWASPALIVPTAI
ncbi:hypothetical protein [Salinirubrum litoreum]|uniref:Uncharacterized protein n=1 Tax=Salinirubrum litoreum TaxID=1126234 RepID=A0ABD5RFY0_9EURY|nr:hypothetical protein [Salinirubrum litoreum]